MAQFRSVLPEPAYLASVGRAGYSVAYTEWLVIEVVTRLMPATSLGGLAAMTMGQIADQLVCAVARAQLEPELRQRLECLAREWKTLVQSRNDIVHARPATDPQGRQRLYRWAPNARPRFITEEALDEVATTAFDIASRLSPLRKQLPLAPTHG